MRRFGIIRETLEGGKEAFSFERNSVQQGTKCGFRLAVISVFIFVRNTPLLASLFNSS